MEREKRIIEKGSEGQIVFDYKPKQFPIVATSSATSFEKGQAEQPKGFQVSELVMQQTGIAELQRQRMEQRIEELALNKLKSIEEKAYQEAYAVGLAEGAEKAFQERKDEFDVRLQKLLELLEDMEKLRERLLVANESQLMRLVALVGEKIAMKEIQTDKQALLSVLKQVMEEVQSEDRITIFLSVEDLSMIEGLKERMGKSWDFLKRVKLEATPNITSGGCILETSHGSIDATLEQRVDRVWEAFVSKIPKIRIEENSTVVEAETEKKDADIEAQKDNDVKKPSGDDGSSQS